MSGASNPCVIAVSPHQPTARRCRRAPACSSSRLASLRTPSARSEQGSNADSPCFYTKLSYIHTNVCASARAAALPICAVQYGLTASCMHLRLLPSTTLDAAAACVSSKRVHPYPCTKFWRLCRFTTGPNGVVLYIYAVPTSANTTRTVINAVALQDRDKPKTKGFGALLRMLPRSAHCPGSAARTTSSSHGLPAQAYLLLLRCRVDSAVEMH